MESDNNEYILMRYGAPNHMDKLPYGTRIKVINDHKHDIYLQSSTNHDMPVWILLGPFDNDVSMVLPDN